MPATIVCPSCQTKLKLPDSALGKQVRCPKCSKTLRVPASGGKSAATPSKPAASARPAASAPGAKKTTIRCPGCSKQLAVSASSAGKVVQCPQCSKKLRIPAAKGSAPGPAAPAAPAPAPAAPSAPESSPFDFDVPGQDFGAPAQGGGFPSSPASGGGGGAPAFGGGGGFPASPPSQAASPYAPPSGNFGKPAGGGSSGGSRSTFYIINGVLITIWGVLMLLGALLRAGQITVLLTTQEIPAEAYARVAGFIAGALFSFVVGTVMTWGGIVMARRSSLAGARTAAVLAALPCPGCLVFPFGIWACFLVFGQHAKKDFGVR